MIGVQSTRLVGHKSTMTTDIYIHMTGADLYGSVEKL